jgi:glycosyltransferase involved in cell wall biosynthesis
MRAFAASEWLRIHFKVVCFGGTSDYLEPELAFFREQGMRDRFIYCSGNDAVLKALYEGAVALVYTSRYEGFGLPPLEAMQCGCPVICCPTSSLPEVVGEAAVFFDPDSPEELTNCMRRVIEDKETREELIRKGSCQANRFSWERTADATLEGYRAICQ